MLLQITTTSSNATTCHGCDATYQSKDQNNFGGRSVSRDEVKYDGGTQETFNRHLCHQLHIVDLSSSIKRIVNSFSNRVARQLSFVNNICSGPVLWRRVAKYVLWKAEENWKARGWGLPFGRENDNEYVLRSMMWADNYWLLCDNKKDWYASIHIIDEVLDLDMEPKPESLWTSTYKYEDAATLKVGCTKKTWDLAFMEVFDVLCYRFYGGGKGFQGADRTMCKGMGSWCRDRYINRSKSVSM